MVVTIEELYEHIKELEKCDFEEWFNSPETQKRLEEIFKELEEHKKLIAKTREISWKDLNEPMTI